MSFWSGWKYMATHDLEINHSPHHGTPPSQPLTPTVYLVVSVISVWGSLHSLGKVSNVVRAPPGVNN